MKFWHHLAPICVALLLLYVTTIVTSQADTVQPPRNLRIARENAGTPDDSLVARWDPPANGNAQLYFFRSRRRPSGSDTWPDFSSYSTSSGTSRSFASPASFVDDESFDFEIEVRTYFNSLGDPVFARIFGVSNRPPRRSSRGKDSESVVIVVDLPPQPPPRTCQSLSETDSGIVISSTMGLGNGIQCQQIGSAGIGIASIIESGFVDAVDVWGNVQHAQVCFVHEQGSFVFLDATTAPRTVTPLEAYISMGMICSDIDRPGSIVLVPSTESVAESAKTEAIQAEVSQAEVSPPDVSQPDSQILSGCWIWTDYVLRLRRVPVDGDIMALVPYDIGLRPIGFSDGWYQVEWFGLRGWITGDLVRTVGNCR